MEFMLGLNYAFVRHWTLIMVYELGSRIKTFYIIILVKLYWTLYNYVINVQCNNYFHLYEVWSYKRPNTPTLMEYQTQCKYHTVFTIVLRLDWKLWSFLIRGARPIHAIVSDILSERKTNRFYLKTWQVSKRW